MIKKIKTTTRSQNGGFNENNGIAADINSQVLVQKADFKKDRYM